MRELSEQELIDLAKLAEVKDPETHVAPKIKTRAKRLPKRNTVKEISDWVSSLQLREGRHQVRSKSLYVAYQLFTKKPIPAQAFFRAFSAMFETKRTNKFNYYDLNLTAFEMQYKSRELAAKYEQKEQTQ